MDALPKPDRLPIGTKLFYGSGTVAFGVKDQGFSALLMLFYNQVMGLPAAWVGAAIMIAMIVDALFDPILGQISDDFRSRWGRRHPFMYAAALPVALTYFFLWSPPHWPPQALFAYLVGLAILVRMCISLYEIPSTALLAEFTSKYDERTTLVAYRYFFGVLGGIVMNILAFKVFLKPDATHSVGQLNPAGYVQYGLFAALIMMVSILISSVGTHRRIARLPMLSPPERPRFLQLLRNMGEVLLHPSYLPVLLSSLFSAMGGGLTLALNIYFSTYLWNFSAGQIATLTASAVIGIVLAFVVALPLSVRFGKKPAALVLFGLSLLFGATPLALRLLGLFPANGDALLLPLVMLSLVFWMMCTIAASILAVSMVADVSEHIQLSTGRRAEGLLFSGATMINKAVSGMGVFLSGLLLAFVRFPEHAKPGQVDPQVMSHLVMVYLTTSVVVSGLAILCLSFYPLTRAHHAEALRKLAEQQP